MGRQPGCFVGNRRKAQRVHFTVPQLCQVEGLGSAFAVNISDHGICLRLPNDSFGEGETLQARLETPLGVLPFSGRIVARHGNYARISVVPQELDLWQDAVGKAVECSIQGWEGGTVIRQGKTCMVAGSLSALLKRDLEYAAKHGCEFDLSEVRHFTRAGLTLCLEVARKYDRKILRYGEHLGVLIPGMESMCGPLCRSGVGKHKRPQGYAKYLVGG